MSTEMSTVMDVVNRTAQAKPADVITLLTTLGDEIGSCSSLRLRVGHLLDLAAALDTLPFDGADELAAKARTAALTLVGKRVDHVAGK